MPKPKTPRHGSMQFWPRKRARRQYPRVRASAPLAEAVPTGFSGYKAGMTHLIIKDERPTSMTKGESIFMPVTAIECPPLKVASIRLYQKAGYGERVVGEILSPKLDKNLRRKLPVPKKEIAPSESIPDFDDVTLKVYTQPALTGIGKKKPEMFEIALGGAKEAKLAYAKDKLDKEIALAEVLKEGQLVDIHAVTKGKGLQGPVKRFGVSLKQHKSEKKKRATGNLGPWQQTSMWRVAQKGQMGYHTRTEYNKVIVKLSGKPEEINQKAGFPHYGIIKNDYILVKGSIQGPQKRLVRLNCAIRPNKKKQFDKVTVEYTRK